MGYYQGGNNFYTKQDHPRYDILPYPINYNQGGHDGTAGFGNDGDCTITAESPGNKGYEAPYWSSNQWANYNNAQNSRTNATGNAYMYFGRRGDTTNTDFGKFDIRNFALFSSVLNSDNADSLHNDGSYRSWLYDYNNYNQSSSLLAYWEFNNGTDDIRDLVGDSHGVNNGATPKGYTSLGFYDTSIDNYPVYGALLNKPSIRESINLDKSKAKTGNLSLSV